MTFPCDRYRFHRQTEMRARHQNRRRQRRRRQARPPHPRRRGKDSRPSEASRLQLLQTTPRTSRRLNSRPSRSRSRGRRQNKARAVRRASEERRFCNSSSRASSMFSLLALVLERESRSVSFRARAMMESFSPNKRPQKAWRRGSRCGFLAAHLCFLQVTFSRSLRALQWSGARRHQNTPARDFRPSRPSLPELRPLLLASSVARSLSPGKGAVLIALERDSIYDGYWIVWTRCETNIAIEVAKFVHNNRELRSRSSLFVRKLLTSLSHSTLPLSSLDLRS